MCQAVSKVVLLLFNFLISLVGIALTVIGALLEWKKDVLIEKIIPNIIPKSTQAEKMELVKLLSEYAEEYQREAIAIFVLGLVIFFIAFFGCCGVLMNSSLLLKIYSVVLILVIICLLIIVIVLATSKDTSRKLLEKILDGYFRTYNAGTGSKIVVDSIQNNLKCCGAGNLEAEFGPNLPDSCCEQSVPCNVTSTDFFNVTCTMAIWTATQPQYKMFLIGLGASTGILALLVAMALYLSRQYNRQTIRN